MIERIRRAYRRHATFLAILLLFISFRILAILLFRPGGFISDFSDYDFYATWGQLAPMGYRVFENLWTAYPPLFPAFMLSIFELASRVPPWVEPRLIFHLYLGLFLLLFETGNLILIYRLSNRMTAEEREPATAAPTSPYFHSAVLYAMLFVPVYTLIGWFEPMPLFFLLLGIDLLLASKRWGWIGSAVAIALGFLVKLTPALFVPIAIRWLGARLSWDAARHEWFDPQSSGNLLKPFLYVILVVVVVAAVGYRLVAGNLDLAFTSFQVQSIRPPWQSVWALLDGYFGYGLVPLDMRNLSGLEGSLWATRLPWRWITLAFLAIYLWLYTRRYAWERVRTLLAFSAISIIWLFLFSKGWSPQFLIWILAFIAMLLPTLRGVTLAIVLSLINFVEANVFLILLPDQHWIMWGTVLLRTLLLLLLAMEFVGQIWPQHRRGNAVRRVSAVATWGVMLAAVVGALLATPRTVQAYEARQWREHPCGSAVEYLRQEAGDPARTIATEQIEVWQTFYPWLRTQYDIHVLDGYSPDRDQADVMLDKLMRLAETGEFWWVDQVALRDRAAAVEPFFARSDVHLLDDQTLGACRVRRVLWLDEAPPLAVADAAGGPIVLREAAVNSPSLGEDLRLVLYWQALARVTESYTVFTQLFDPAGQLVAQQDNLPVQGLAPTDSWAPNRLIRDPYRLSIPAGSEAGAYRLLIGLYDGDGRQMLLLPDGTRSDHLALTFEIREQ